MWVVERVGGGSEGVREGRDEEDGWGWCGGWEGVVVGVMVGVWVEGVGWG